MIFSLHKPSIWLSSYIENIVYYKGYTPEHQIERLLPDGGIDLVIDLTDVPKFIYDNETLEEKQACRKGWISGIRTSYISIQARASVSEMMVIRFRPGTAWAILQVPLIELKEKVLDAELILGTDFFTFREKLLFCLHPEEKFAVAEAYFEGKLKKQTTHHPVIQYSIARILMNPAQVTIKDIVQKTGYTHKHLISLFGKYTGVHPKQYVNILKFQQVVHLLESGEEIKSWARFALDCGYYDQSHFINEFKRFSGLNPTAYPDARGEYINYLPLR